MNQIYEMLRARFRKSLPILLALAIPGALLSAAWQPGLARSPDQTATLSCRLESGGVTLGGQANLLIEVKDVKDLYGYQLELSYPHDTIEILDSDDQAEGANLELVTLTPPGNVYVVRNQAAGGKIEVAVTQFGNEPAYTGDYLLVRGKVRGLKLGPVSLEFGEVILTDGTLNGNISTQIVNCSGNVVPEGGIKLYIPLIRKG